MGESNPFGWWKARRRDVAMVACVALFFALFFWQPLFQGQFVIAGDPLFYSYPLRTLAWEMLQQGTPPVWTPHVLSGYPLLAVASLALGYPLTWGYLCLPGHWAEQLYVLAPFLLSPLFTYAYTREVGRSRVAALLAGLSFGYGGMMCGNIASSGVLTNSMMWLPLMLVAIDRARHAPFAPCLLGATSAYAMAVLNGHPQSFIYAGLVALAYGVFCSVVPRMTGDEREEQGKQAWWDWRRWRPLATAAAAMVLSAGVAAFQILETMRAARRSVRSALTYESFSDGSFTLIEAARSLVSPLYHRIDVTTFVAPLAIVLAVVACLAMWRRELRDARVYFWLAVAVAAWVLMLGSNTPAQHLAFRVPALNSFRVPSRHAFEWTFALSVLAAYGWDAARKRLSKELDVPASPRDWRTAGALVMLALTACAGVLWWRAVAVTPAIPNSNNTDMPEADYLLWKTGFTVCLFVGVWLAWGAAARWRGGLIVFAVALACFVESSMVWGQSFLWGGYLLPAQRFDIVSPTTRLLQQFPPEQNRVYSRVGIFVEEFTGTPRLEGLNLTALHGLHNVGGMEPLILERYSRALGGVGPDSVSPRPGFAPNLDLFTPQSHVLDLLNTRFVVSYANLSIFDESLIVKEGVSFPASDLGIDLRPGNSAQLHSAATPADTLMLVTNLANSTPEKQGMIIARLRIHTGDGQVIERDLRAGLNTSEWAHERADVRTAIQHALAPVYDSAPNTGEDGRAFSAYRFLARVDLGGRVRIEKIEIENVSERASLAVSKALLYDAMNRTSTPIFDRFALDRWEPIYNENHVLVLRNARALPRAWLASQAEAVDGEEALRRIRGESVVPFDPRRTALLEVAANELPALLGGAPLPDDAARVVSYEANRLAIETSADSPAVLVISEINYPGWEARLDGAPVPVHQTNFLLRGVIVPAGRHRVEMRYAAPAARNGAMISAFTLLLLGGLAVVARRYRPARQERFSGTDRAGTGR